MVGQWKLSDLVTY